MSPNSLQYWVALALARGVGARTGHLLLQQFGSPREIFKASRKELQMAGLSPEAISELTNPDIERRAEEELKRAKRYEASLISYGDENYPELLRQIYDPPLVIYFKGSIEVFQRPAIALVGTRAPTPYGLQVAEALAADLARAGACVVSGLARGIDSAAHRGALVADGATIAVFGNGIDIIYPRENGKLAARILEKGALISEFPMGTYPAPQNFPVRNRVISGLSLGTVIIEASEYSGSLITARMALEQNREVFAVPGNITSTKSFGPNYLIKQGAKLVQDWRDIVEELPPEAREKLSGRSEATAQDLPLMTQDEDRVFKLVPMDQPLGLDRLIDLSGLDMGSLSQALLGLEVKGLIKQLPGKNFVRR